MSEYSEKFPIKKIKKLLKDGFSDGELTDFTQDNFYEVYRTFGEQTDPAGKIRKLIDYVIINRQIEKLLEVLKEDYPDIYHRFESDLQSGKPHPDPLGKVSTKKRSSAVSTPSPKVKKEKKPSANPTENLLDSDPPSEMKGDFYKYSCDRDDQTIAFKKNYDSSEETETSFQFYFILGEEKQSPYGLFARIVYGYLTDSNSTRIFLRNDGYNLEKAYILLMNDLFRSFGFNPNTFNDADDFTLSKLLESNIVSGQAYIPVEIRIYSRQWKSFLPKLIKRFTEEFCTKTGIAPNQDTPKFLFFWSIVYSSDMQDNRLLAWWKKWRIKWTLRRLSKAVVLPELSKVSRDDISSWLDKFEFEDSLKQKIIKKYFDVHGQLDMTDVEPNLEQIINDYNDGEIG